jgi:hypothetical protein
MSNSMIDELVKVHTKNKGKPDEHKEYTVTGRIGDQGARQQGSGSVSDVCIRVMIFQTVRDIGGSATDTHTHAFAMSEGKVVADSELINGQRPFTATMTHRPVGREPDQPRLEEFDPDRRATGLAVSVDCTDDPAGFEIFTWSGPIRFELDPTASPA